MDDSGYGDGDGDDGSGGGGGGGVLIKINHFIHITYDLSVVISFCSVLFLP